jgi:hypothetical protein
MDSGFMTNINNTVSPPPQMAMQVTVATPICKSLGSHSQYIADNSKGSTADKRHIVEREWLSRSIQLPIRLKPRSSKWPSRKSVLELHRQSLAEHQLKPLPHLPLLPPQRQLLLLLQQKPLLLHHLPKVDSRLAPELSPTVLANAHASALLVPSPTLPCKVSVHLAVFQVSDPDHISWMPTNTNRPNASANVGEVSGRGGVEDDGRVAVERLDARIPVQMMVYDWIVLRMRFNSPLNWIPF